jgi:hypothetical protein
MRLYLVPDLSCIRMKVAVHWQSTEPNKDAPQNDGDDKNFSLTCSFDRFLMLWKNHIETCVSHCVTMIACFRGPLHQASS